MTPEQLESLCPTPKLDTSQLNEDQLRAYQKFSFDGPFNDPVLMCDACQELVLKKVVHKVGMCPECSNTRLRNVRTMNAKRYQQLKEWADSGEIDPDFLHLFGVVQ